jgi:AcrR family transcriptional regulator
MSVMTRPAARARLRRVPPQDRRRQLVERASVILTRNGIEHLQVTSLAASARVSRPLVYRMFPTRLALIEAVLEDFSEIVNERFRSALVRTLPGTIETITLAFVNASCDAIEARGAGPWRLLDAKGADPAIARVGRRIFSKLLSPWEQQLATHIGTSPRRAGNLLWIIVAAGRAALDGWIDGALTRVEAVEDATRAVSALLVAFTIPKDA